MPPAADNLATGSAQSSVFEEAFDFGDVVGAAVGWEGVEEGGAVARGADARVEQHEDAAVCERADEAAEALLECDDGLGDLEVVEGVAAGGNAFNDLQVPQAVIALKQGFGRLIRSLTDRGVLMLLDSRIRTTRYGATFLDSLPPYRRTDDITEVERFFEN